MKKYNLDHLSLDQKIGQLFSIGFDALNLNNHVVSLIEECSIGNFILFTRNIDTPKQLLNLTKSLYKKTKEVIGIPPFICIDQEGGMVTRIKNHLTFYPGEMTVSATNDSHNAYLVGKYMGDDLASFGININLAPVLDVNNNPFNPVIGVRSYSDNPDKVSEYGNQFIAGLQEKIIATGKHFPGHGDTMIDSHLALPTITVSNERFRSVELKPFVSAINAGLKAVMSSHVNFPGITEDDLPTTLSKNCLTGLLRDELKFEGLILTDCMEMKAIQKLYTTKEGVLMSILAGANLVGISHTLELQKAAFYRVKEAVLSGELPMNILNERVQRVLDYKNEMAPFDEFKDYREIQNQVENHQKMKFAQDLVFTAVSLIKGSTFKNKKNAMLIAFEPQVTSIADETSSPSTIVSKVNQLGIGIQAFSLGVNPSNEEMDELLEKTLQYNQILVCEYNSNQYRSQIDLINRLHDYHQEVHVLSMRNPYVLFQTKEIQNYVCFYEYTPNSINALIEYLKGNLIPRGKVPVQYV